MARIFGYLIKNKFLKYFFCIKKVYKYKLRAKDTPIPIPIFFSILRKDMFLRIGINNKNVLVQTCENNQLSELKYKK